MKYQLKTHGSLIGILHVFIASMLITSLTPLPLSAGANQQSEPAETVQPGVTEPGSEEQSPARPPEDQQVAPTLTLPPGTLITGRIMEFLSSDRNQPGDGFTAVLQQPLVVDGWVVARRGQSVLGRVTAVQKAGRSKGVSELSLELTELILVDGQQVGIRTQLAQFSAGTSRGSDAEAIGTATGIGAAIGAVAGGGQGAGIGAAAGAAAGVAGVLATRGRPTIVYPETSMAFRLEDQVTISTERSQQAYRPVTQEDYDGERALVRRQGRHTADPSDRRAYPPPPPPYYYDDDDDYGPPPFYPRFYGFYGYGPRFYGFVGPRIYFGRGFHHRY